MKERLGWWLIVAILYSSMWLVGIFPIQVIVAWIYQVDYVFPTRSTIQSLSSLYWGVVIIPPLFRFLGRLAAVLLGDVWIDIQNEFSLFTHWATHGEVKQTFWARLRAIVSMALFLYGIFWVLKAIISYNTATALAISLWSSVVITYMQWLAKRRVYSEEE